MKYAGGYKDRAGMNGKWVARVQHRGWKNIMVANEGAQAGEVASRGGGWARRLGARRSEVNGTTQPMAKDMEGCISTGRQMEHENKMHDALSLSFRRSQ